MKHSTVDDILKDLSVPKTGQSICGLVLSGPARGKTLVLKKLHLVSTCTTASVFVQEKADPKAGALALAEVETRPILVTMDQIRIETEGEKVDYYTALRKTLHRAVVRSPDVSFWTSMGMSRRALEGEEPNELKTQDEFFDKLDMKNLDENYAAFDVILISNIFGPDYNKAVVYVARDRVSGHQGKKVVLDPVETIKEWKGLVGPDPLPRTNKYFLLSKGQA